MNNKYRKIVTTSILLCIIIASSSVSLAQPYQIVKTISRVYTILPNGKVIESCTVKIEIYGTYHFKNFKDIILFSSSKSLVMIGNSPIPYKIVERNYSVLLYWENLHIWRKGTIQYQLKSNIQIVRVSYDIWVNNKKCRLKEVKGAYLLKVQKGDLLKVKYYIKNTIPLYINVHNELYRAVLPLLITLAIDENKLIIKNVEPPANFSSKMGNTKVFVWFVLLANKPLNLTLTLLIKRLGPWKELRFLSPIIKVDFDVNKYLRKINENIETLQKELGKINKSINSLHKLVNLYNNYSKQMENLTKTLDYIGLLLYNNVSKILLKEARLMAYYEYKLSELINKTEKLQKSVEEVIHILKAINETLFEIKNTNNNITKLLRTINEKLKNLTKYNVTTQEKLLDTSLLNTTLTLLETSSVSTELILSLLEDLITHLKEGLTYTTSYRDSMQKFVKLLKTYSRMQYEFGINVKVFGRKMLFLSNLLRNGTIEINNMLSNYTSQIKELEKIRDAIRNTLRKLYELKYGLLALRIFRIIEGSSFSNLSLTYTVTSKGIIIHPTNDTLPHNVIVNENIEIFLPNFHLTSILNLPSKMKNIKENTDSKGSYHNNYLWLSLLPMALLILLFIKVKRKKRKVYYELIKRIDKLIIAIEHEIKENDRGEEIIN